MYIDTSNTRNVMHLYKRTLLVFAILKFTKLLELLNKIRERIVYSRLLKPKDKINKRIKH